MGYAMVDLAVKDFVALHTTHSIYTWFNEKETVKVMAICTRCTDQP